MVIWMKALLGIGGLAFLTRPALAQSAEIIQLQGVELGVYDLKLAFEHSIRSASDTFKTTAAHSYHYNEFIHHGVTQSEVAREFVLRYNNEVLPPHKGASQWQLITEKVISCKENELPYPDLVFLNHTLHLSFYKELFTQFLDRLVITEEAQAENHLKLSVVSKAMGAIDRLSAEFDINRSKHQINRIVLNLIIDPNYESGTQQWRTRSLFIEVSFDNGMATDYQAHTILHSRQNQMVTPLIFRQYMRFTPEVNLILGDLSLFSIDLNKALKPGCAL